MGQWEVRVEDGRFPRIYPIKDGQHDEQWVLPLRTRLWHGRFMMSEVRWPTVVSHKSLRTSILLCQIWCNRKNRKHKDSLSPGTIEGFILDAKKKTGVLPKNHE